MRARHGLLSTPTHPPDHEVVAVVGLVEAAGLPAAAGVVSIADTTLVWGGREGT